MDGLFFSFISSPAEQDPDKGLAEPAERPRRERSDRSGLEAVRRVTAERWHPQLRRQTVCGLPERGARRRMEPRRGLACGWRPCAAECAGLRNKSADFGGAMRSADLRAARRSERPWREPPAYADRIGRSAFDSSYSRNRDRRITALSRACICESDGSGAGTSATGSKGESASAGT